MAIRRILYPTDFSEPARYAGRYACKLAHKLGAEVYILYVMTFPLPPGEVPAKLTGLKLAELREKAQRRAKAELDRCLQENGFRGLKLRTAITLGIVEDEILQAAAQSRSELIVMGTHARTGLARALLGSVTEKVARTASCPVLAVKHPEVKVELPWGGTLVGRRRVRREIRFRRILVPLDGSPLAEGILPEATKLAKALDAKLILLRVAPALIPAVFPIEVEPAEIQAEMMEEATSYLEKKQQTLEREGVTVQTAVRYGDAALEILECAESEEVDLVAMATHGRSGLKRWFLGSVAEKVLRASDIPVLLFRAWKPSKARG